MLLSSGNISETVTIASRASHSKILPMVYWFHCLFQSSNERISWWISSLVCSCQRVIMLSAQSSIDYWRNAIIYHATQVMEECSLKRLFESFCEMFIDYMTCLLQLSQIEVLSLFQHSDRACASIFKSKSTFQQPIILKQMTSLNEPIKM